jgi:N-acetylmuramoyl-L-alanine amidase
MIALVIGHSNKSKGAYNKTFNISEFEFNEKLVNLISKDLNKELIKNEIIYRSNYNELPNKINELKPNFIVSFHCNAFNTKVSGTEMLYYHSSKNGKQIAEIFQTNIVSCLELPDRNIKPKHTEDRGGYLLRYTNAPCIISEPFFIDNDYDYKKVMERYFAFIKANVDSFIEVNDKLFS